MTTIDTDTDRLAYWLSGFLSGSVRALTRLTVDTDDGNGLAFRVRSPDGTAVRVTVDAPYPPPP